MSSLSMPAAYLIGVLLEGFLYGISTTTFITCVRDLTHRRRTPEINMPMLICSCGLWLGVTIHWGVAIRRCLIGFIDYSTVSGGAQSFLNQVNTTLWVTSEIAFGLTSSLADFLLIYRCWLIWNNNYWIIIAPFCSMMGTFVCFVYALYQMIVATPEDTIALPVILHAGDALFSFSLATNVITTLLIAGRIFYLIRTHLKSIPREHTQQYISIIGIIVESGALMAITQAIFISLWASLTIFLWTVYAILAQVMAISPMLIIVRASANASQSNPAMSVVTPVVRSPFPGVPGAGTTTAGRWERPIILTEIETHRDPSVGARMDDSYIMYDKGGAASESLGDA